MTRSRSTMPFHNLTFIDDMAKLRNIEGRWKTFLKRVRQQAQDADPEAAKIAEGESDRIEQMNAEVKRRAA